jgi:hypothetical protein
MAAGQKSMSDLFLGQKSVSGVNDRPMGMGRLSRVIDDGPVYHTLNRGNRRSAVFADDADHAAFLRAPAAAKDRYPFRLFGYCPMTNHFHFLLRTEPGQSVSRILQSLLWPTPGDITSAITPPATSGRGGSRAR